MDATIKLRCLSGELERWKAQAEEENETLSSWIRARCNGAIEAGAVAQSLDDRVNPEADLPTRRKVKQCAHGVEKGSHCWQCRGLAEA
jgi:hypothetical protein